VEHESVFWDLKKSLTEAPMLGHPMAGQPYHMYLDASDVALGASLQQVQPIKLKDLQGSKAYNRIMSAYKAGDTIPQLACQVSKCIDNVPTPRTWEKLEDTIMFIE
jgi:RNase H-like domain found in reverse transcriptase